MKKNERERACGSCRACCFTHVVTSATIEGMVTVTDPFQHCRYECAKGCAIYQQRPPACKEYECAWLKGEITGEDNRPDKLGLVIDFQCSLGDETMGGKVTYIAIMEAWSGASKSKQAKRFIRQLSSTNNTQIVVIGPEGTATIYCPEDMKEESAKLIRYLTLLQKQR